MKLIRDPHSQAIQSVVTIGNFDGVHLGHQKLMTELVAAAKTFQLPSVLLTFEPHPIEFFQKMQAIARIMRFSEKWRAVSHYAIDYFYCLRFNAALSNLSAEAFVQTILVQQLGVKKVIIGDDFQFGAKRLGTVDLLKKMGEQYGFEVQAISQLMDQSDRISSTRIRTALSQGDFQTVLSLTHQPFCLSGRVAYGNQIGRQLGFPTANIYLQRKQVPLMGVFIVRVHGLQGRVLAGAASIGYRPTFGGKQVLLEVHLLDFNETIYGKPITVEFIQKIRDEWYFESVEALIAKMQEDVQIARDYFAFNTLA